MVIAFGLLVVFLVLAAQYESFTLPVAVLLAVPLGILGGMIAATVLAIFFVPVFYVLVQWVSERFTGPPQPISPEQTGLQSTAAKPTPHDKRRSTRVNGVFVKETLRLFRLR